MQKIETLRVKIFLDGADLEDLKKLANLSYIKGFTTNPTLMRKAGHLDYEKFVNETLAVVKEKPVSFEVISDDFEEMRRQALKLSKKGENIYVKIPVMNTKGESSIALVVDLLERGIKVNVTAVMTIDQVRLLKKAITSQTPAIISVFAGRIADTGIDPIPVMRQAKRIIKNLKNVELLWASPRELLNIFHAEESNCDIITVLPDVLKKINIIGYDLHNFSLDTVRMFYNDAISSGLKL